MIANLIRHRALHKSWQSYQANCQILRAQLGFNGVESSSPEICRGCLNYHGKSYGQNRATRSQLICALHPYGWRESPTCPDRREE